MHIDLILCNFIGYFVSKLGMFVPDAINMQYINIDNSHILCRTARFDSDF